MAGKVDIAHAGRFIGRADHQRLEREAARRVAAAGAALALPAWAQPSRIVLGQSAAFSGTAAQLCIQMHKGAKICFDQLNAKGGVGGRLIEIRQLDDGYEPDRCQANTEKLIKDEVFALFGYIGTPTSLAALQVRPGNHGVVVPRQEGDVAGAAPQHVRDDHDRVPPARRRLDREDLAAVVRDIRGGVGLVERPRHRHDDRDQSVLALLRAHIAQPARQEQRHVGVVRRGRREDLDVARPPRPLPLRAVGRHGQQVAALAPHHVVVQLVQPGVAARPRALVAQVAGDHDGREVGRRGCGRPAGQPRVPEPVERELGLPRLAVGVAAAAGADHGMTFGIALQNIPEGWIVASALLALGMPAPRAAAIAVAVGLRLVLRRTRLGVAMRAIVDDRALLQLNGGRPGRTAMLAWAIGAGLAAVSGVLIASEQTLSAVTLTLLVINAYAVAVVGRGVKRGIERASTLLMPIFIIVLLILLGFGIANAMRRCAASPKSLNISQRAAASRIRAGSTIRPRAAEPAAHSARPRWNAC